MSTDYFPRGRRKSFDKLMTNLPDTIVLKARPKNSGYDVAPIPISKTAPFDPTLDYFLSSKTGSLQTYFNSEHKFTSATLYGGAPPYEVFAYLGFHWHANIMEKCVAAGLYPLE
jgi:hypothetical protein